MVESGGPLKGVKCISMTMFQAGPVCFAHFADLGAEVIKIERPGTGELGRQLTRYPNIPISPYFETNNRGVKSLTLDIRQPSGKEILYRLVKDADIFGQNFRPGAAERNGFGYEDLIKINPKLVYLAISTYGPDGPNVELPGTDAAAQAAGGIASTFAQPGAAMRTGQVSVADETAGMTAFAGAMAALYHAKMTGQGQRVDTSLLGGQIRLMGYTMARTLLFGKAPVSGGQVRLSGGAAPNFAASFDDKDGKSFVFQVVGDAAWQKGMKAAGLDETVAEIGCSKLTDVAASKEKQVIFLDKLKEIFASNTREHWVKILRAADIVSAPINDLLEAAQEEDTIANKYVTEIEHPKHGKIKVLGSPWKFSETPVKLGVAPELGADNEDILKGIGYSAADIARFQQEKAI